MHNKLDDFSKRRDFGNLEANLHFLNKTGLVDKQEKLLEIGSGKGALLNYFYRKGYDIMGVDINERWIKESRELFGDLPLSLVDSEQLPLNRTYDIVMSFDAFEHIPDSDKHLQEVNRVLKEGGYYLLQTPNKLTNTVFETIRWKSFTRWREDHCSTHSYWEIKKRFRRNGFKVEFYDIPVVTEFFKKKVETYLGGFGLFMLKFINPDKLPMFMKSNFYIKAKKIK